MALALVTEVVPGLSQREALFAREYVKDPSNIEAAAKRAGYKSFRIHACKLIRRPRIVDEIQRLQRATAAQAAKSGVTPEYITEKTVEILERCLGRDGEPFNPTGAARAVDILAKRVGYYELDNKQRAGSRLAELPVDVQEALLLHMERRAQALQGVQHLQQSAPIPGELAG